MSLYTPISTPSLLEPEGIYWARYTVNGRPALYYVDSNGERLYETTLHDGERGEDAEARVADIVAIVKRYGTPVPPRQPKLFQLRRG